MIQVQYKKNTSMIQVREGDPNTLLKTYRPKKRPIDLAFGNKIAKTKPLR